MDEFLIFKFLYISVDHIFPKLYIKKGHISRFEIIFHESLIGYIKFTYGYIKLLYMTLRNCRIICQGYIFLYNFTYLKKRLKEQYLICHLMHFYYIILKLIIFFICQGKFIKMRM